MSGLNQETPISISMLNKNMDANLAFDSKYPIIYINDSTGSSELEIWSTQYPLTVGAMIQLFGWNVGGGIYFNTPNAAHTAFVRALSIDTSGDSALINALNHRIKNVGAITDNGDALPFQAWANWSPTLTWTGGTPTGFTNVFRWTQIGKTVFFVATIYATDGNGATNLTISLPVQSENATVFTGYQRVDLTYYNDIDPSVQITSSTLIFVVFHTATAGKTFAVRVSGLYEVA